MFFDTHAHYDDRRFDCDRDALLSSLPQKGISLAVNAASNVQSVADSQKLAETYDYICFAAGVHPHEAEDMREGDLDLIARALEHPKCVALGEIGLDYHYDFSPRDIQQKHFEEQLALACELKRPVVIHDREAHGDILQALKKYAGLRGVLHSFSGSTEMAQLLIGMGFYLSFNGIITFPNTKKSLDVILQMPRERLLIETDAPYLTPIPHRGKRNDSSYIIHTAAKIGELLSMSVEDVAALTMKNGRECFGI